MSSASTSAHSTVSQGEANNDLSYKERLDKAAEKVKNSHNNNSNGGGLVNQVVEKGDKPECPRSCILRSTRLTWS